MEMAGGLLRLGRCLVADQVAISQALISEPNGTLFVLFIPSKDRVPIDIPDQEFWIRGAELLLTELYGGATTMPMAKGMWRNPQTGIIIEEKVALIHSYCRISQAALHKVAVFASRWTSPSLRRRCGATKRARRCFCTGLPV